MIGTRSVAAALTIAAVAVPARAGWRPVETLLIDAGAGDADSKRCVDDVARRLKQAGEDITLVRKRLDAVRAKLPTPLPPDLLAWTDATAAALREGKNVTYDAIVVVDCRPAARAIDLVIDPIAPGVVTLRVRGLPATAPVIDWLGSRIERASYAGFSL